MILRKKHEIVRVMTSPGGNSGFGSYVLGGFSFFSSESAYFRIFAIFNFRMDDFLLICQFNKNEKEERLKLKIAKIQK